MNCSTKQGIYFHEDYELMFSIGTQKLNQSVSQCAPCDYSNLFTTFHDHLLRSNGEFQLVRHESDHSHHTYRIISKDNKRIPSCHANCCAVETPVGTECDSCDNSTTKEDGSLLA